MKSAKRKKRVFSLPVYFMFSSPTGELRYGKVPSREEVGKLLTGEIGRLQGVTLIDSNGKRV